LSEVQPDLDGARRSECADGENGAAPADAIEHTIRRRLTADDIAAGDPAAESAFVAGVSADDATAVRTDTAIVADPWG